MVPLCAKVGVEVDDVQYVYIPTCTAPAKLYSPLVECETATRRQVSTKRYSSTAAKHNSVRFCDILNRSDSSENEMRKSINADEHFVTNLKIQWIAPNHSRFIFLSNSKRHVPIPP